MQEAATALGASRPLVLVADDDEDIRALVTLRLERSGYRVLAARDGEEALRLAVHHRPQLAILDVTMPKIDGYELTRRLRRHDETRRIAVILLTARVQESDVARGFEAGADDYIRKPFSPEELRARVQAILVPSDDRPLVLVADDDPDILDLVALRLSRASYRVVTARDGVEALDRAIELTPDLVVLDVGMPRLDGLETSRRLRADPRTSHIPIVFLTARVQEADVIRGYADGGDGYVTKPFEPNDLLARVDSLVGVGRLRALAG